MTIVTDLPAPSGFTEGPDVWQALIADTSEDVKGRASPEVSAALRRPERLVAWLRALTALEADVNGRMGDDRLRLDAMRPAVHTGPEMDAYRAEKREQADRHAARLRFRMSCANRLRECRHLLAEHGLNERLTVESMLETIARASDYLDRDEIDVALNLLDRVLRDAYLPKEA